MDHNCYKCKHRGEVQGSAHSRCDHPLSGSGDNLGQLIAALGNPRGIVIPTGNNALEIKGDPHGIRNGWFNWPYNFDPIWLENCNGFEEKDETR